MKCVACGAEGVHEVKSLRCWAHNTAIEASKYDEIVDVSDAAATHEFDESAFVALGEKL